MEKTRQWSILTAIGVLAVFVAGWFLLVSPQRSNAADLRSQAGTQESTNNGLRARVAQLEAQKKGLPAQQRILADIAEKIPASPELPALIRQLSTAAEAAGVDLVTLAPAAPTSVTASAPTAAASTAGPTAGTTAGSTASAATDAAAAGSGTTAPTTTTATSATPLYQIPVSVTVRGTYFNLDRFFANVEKLERAMLVPTFAISPIETQSGASSGGGASVPPGSLTATLSTIVFESPATTVPASTTAAQ